MSEITIDTNSAQKEIYLSGDIENLKRHRFAWRYLQDYFHPVEASNQFIIHTGESEIVSILIKIHAMLIKYGFEEKHTNCSEKILDDFYEEEKKFALFSEQARHIRNNECNSADFRKFTDSLSKNLTARSLYPLQLLSAYHLAFAQNACNFSVPGSGKTSIVYGAYAYMHGLPMDDSRHVDCMLIVGPLSSFGPWELEYKECFGRSVKAKRLIGGLSKEDKCDYLYSRVPDEITLISYASVVTLQKELLYFLSHHKTMIVLDEAHKIKNSSGGIISQTVLSLAQYGKSRVVLTGTPAPNGYEDLYNMFKFIWPNKNVIGFEINQLRDITSHKDKSRTQRLIENISPFFIRIQKKFLEIPPATIHDPIMVPMGEYQRRIYDFIEKKYMKDFMESATIDLSSKFKNALTQARIIRLMQAASDPTMLKKPLETMIDDEDAPSEAYQAIDDSEVLKAILDYGKLETPAKYIAVEKIVQQIINKGEKVIIWANFIHSILGLKKYLLSKGIESRELYGAIPIEQDNSSIRQENEIMTRERIIEEFHSNTCPYKVLIANPFAVAESISLHKTCHNAIYIERSFNAAHFVQSKDRIHRYGLKMGTETNYYFIVSEDSIDETINTRLSEKEHRMIEIMESMPIPLFDNIYEDLGDEDIKKLIGDYVRRIKKS